MFRDAPSHPTGLAMLAHIVHVAKRSSRSQGAEAHKLCLCVKHSFQGKRIWCFDGLGLGHMPIERGVREEGFLRKISTLLGRQK